MRIGKRAHTVDNLRQLASTARSAAELVNASPDPPQALAMFYTTFTARLRATSLPAPVPGGPRPPLTARARSIRKA
jgi:hypothetical protein